MHGQTALQAVVTQGITVIDGGCPLMFGPTADFGHKVLRLIYAGNVPKQV